ncbi:protein spaetzle-like isoform X2 [Periplaneta americana]
MARCSVSGLLLVSSILVLYFGVTVQARSTDRRKRDPQATKPADNACGTGNSFCDNVADYPIAKIKEILEKEKGKHGDIFGVESQVPKEMPNTIMSRMGETESYLCPSRSQIIFPKVGENKDGNKQYIVNNEDDKQGIRVEICEHSGECSLSSSFPSGYKTKCVQKYVYKRMLALKEDGSSTAVDEFKFPSCCSCSVSGPFK